MQKRTRGESVMVWAGRIVSLLPVFIVLTSSRWKLTQAPFYVREWGRIGWQVKDLPFVASLQLGAILLTGYLGGAIASYVRIGAYYPPLVPLTTAMLAWLGIFLRDKRLRQLLPFRTRMQK